MDIGPYTFSEFKEIARRFHGYPAPGLLLGGYMVESAKAKMPEGVLYEAVVETGKCLPDAVQILTVLSVGNNWMKIVNLGRYALSLYDKYTGEGWRVYLDGDKLQDWPHMKSWLTKSTLKKDQDTEALFAEIELAGDTVCSAHPIQIHERFLGKAGMGTIGLCPVCREYYPTRDGAICRGCQGDAPYASTTGASGIGEHRAQPRAVSLEQAVGKTAAHDMTRIVPGESKGPAIQAGEVITGGDLCRLQQMGRERVYVEEEVGALDGYVHENEVVLAFAERMAGTGVSFTTPPREGKVDFRADRDGLLVIDREQLKAFNSLPDVMCATRQSEIFVAQDKTLAGTRAIPLYISRSRFTDAQAVLDKGPLLRVLPLRRMPVGILVTGSEVFQGLIEDKFAPLIQGKVAHFGCPVAAEETVPDDAKAIAGAVRRLREAGAELIVTTAGLSVDPDDVTRQGLLDAGLTDMLYGAPILPGAMTLLGRIGDTRVLGVPACALFYKTTSLDLLLPRILAQRPITRADLAEMAEGSFCMSCTVCTFPKCPFGK